MAIQCSSIKHNMHLKFGQIKKYLLKIWMINYNLFWKEDNMLTGKQKRFLRAEANQLKPIFQVGRSEEHTSELQSRGHLVCRLLLEKKKNESQNISKTPQ